MNNPRSHFKSWYGRTSGALLCSLALLTSTGACGVEAFAPARGSPYRAGARPSSVVAADFDGDGKLDILAACSGGDSVGLLLDDGRGGFAPCRFFPAMARPHLLAVGDWNGDGKPGVAVSAHNLNEIVLLRNDGRGNLERLPPIPVFDGTQPHNHGLAVGDLNEDGRADITVGHQGVGRIAVLLGDGQAGFRHAPDSQISVGRSPYPHTLADVNGDRHLDLVVPDVQGNQIRLFAGDGRGRFRPLPDASTGIERPYFVLARDVNGDGRGGFRHASGSPFDGRAASWKGDVADQDGDGKVDLALAGGGSVRIFSGDGRGGFHFRSSLSTKGESWDVILADVNRDGRADVITPSGAADVIHVFVSP